MVVALSLICCRSGNNRAADEGVASEAAAHDHSGYDHTGHDHANHSHAAGEHRHHKGEGSHDGTAAAHDHKHDHKCAETHAGHSHDANTPHSAARGEEDAVNEIFFPAAQAARIDFEVTRVEPSRFSEVIRTGGRIMAAQGEERVVAAPVSGIVSFSGVRLTEGNSVRGAQPLFYISSRNIVDGDIAQKNAAAYQKARSDYERSLSLLADNIVSQREFEAIELEYLQAKAAFEALSGMQSERGTAVSAPIAGYVTSLAVSEGDYVEVGQTLATVSQNRRLVLRADVSKRYFTRLKEVRSANFTTPYDDATYRLDELDGKLISVGRSSAAGSPLMPVTFEFNNNGRVVPGSVVEVYLLGAPVSDAITLPLTALTEQQGLFYVYVRLDADHYEARQVTTGGNDGRIVRILSGIEIGDDVVTRGAMNVKLASASGAIPHSHEH